MYKVKKYTVKTENVCNYFDFNINPAERKLCIIYKVKVTELDEMPNWREEGCVIIYEISRETCSTDSWTAEMWHHPGSGMH